MVYFWTRFVSACLKHIDNYCKKLAIAKGVDYYHLEMENTCEITGVTHIVVHCGQVRIDANGYLCPSTGQLTYEQHEGRLDVTVVDVQEDLPAVICRTNEEQQLYLEAHGLPDLSKWKSAKAVAFSGLLFATNVSPVTTSFEESLRASVTARSKVVDTTNVVCGTPVKYKLAPGTRVEKVTVMAKCNLSVETNTFMSSDLIIVINKESFFFIPRAEFDTLLVQIYGGCLYPFMSPASMTRDVVVKNLNVLVNDGHLNGMRVVQSAVISTAGSGTVLCGRMSTTKVCVHATGESTCNMYNYEPKQ